MRAKRISHRDLLALVDGLPRPRALEREPMSPDVAAPLARITRSAEDLHWTEAHLRRQRTMLREQATALRLGESPAVMVARLRAAKVWSVAVGARVS